MEIREQAAKANGKASMGLDLALSPEVEKRPLFIRYFSSSGQDPLYEVKWTKRDAAITNERGEVVFRQEGVEVPESWSQMATDVVVSKYFRGAVGKPERETSVRQLVGRVVDTITKWGVKDGYFKDNEEANIFRDELAALLLKQYGAFNSPVWFNVGVEPRPQCSACFILSVEDTMESLLDLQRAEAMLFKYGSGAGSNLSKIRSSKERLSGGGVASGPVSFMRGYDAWAGTIKSGGKTRRAAKMQILDVDHPDIHDFIRAKRREEEKAWALIEQGFDGGFNVPGGAYDSVFFQNSNLSVRVTDEFMRAVESGGKFELRARTDGSVVDNVDAGEMLREIAQGTWVCGDPGLQFDTTINDWHTCPNSGRINASNPCSEYMHVDDSACNLASLNLLNFLGEDGAFDAEGLRRAVSIFITAQDIVVDNSSYPTERIGANAHRFRQLGLGFANLGSLLMCKGLSYDSEEGRTEAASVMALLCGEAYRTSAELAGRLGAFAEFESNREAMLGVIGKHRESARALCGDSGANELASEAQKVWDAAYRLGESNGFRNSQATVLAPTGTIAFMMDCDTTGIEPDISLVKYKKLVGGGVLRIVNQSVARALANLGYSKRVRDEIVAYVEEHGTIEGAPGLEEKHLPVFDCAFKPLNGQRSIHYMGHLRMMSAVQPFVSGAISKTVNMPEQATVEEIYNTYLDAWRLGLKAVAIYRDNSKRSQPLSTGKDKEKESANHEAAHIKRRHLPDERDAVTHKFNVAGHEGYITVGLYEDGSPGEIFLVMSKEGSTLSGVMDAFATSISLALQYGVPLGALVKKFTHMRFEPSGYTTSKKIPYAKSILDYIFQWLGQRFLSTEEQIKLGLAAPENANGDKHGANGLAAANAGAGSEKSALPSKDSMPYVSDDAPPCTVCGSSLMVRQGSCYRCLICGSQGGCG